MKPRNGLRSKFMDVHGWWEARWMIVGRSPMVPATSYDLASGWWFSRFYLSMGLHEPCLHDRFTDLRLWKKQPHGRRQVAFWKSLGSAGLVGESNDSSSAGRCDFAGSSAQVRVIVYDLQWWNISKKGSKGISPQYFLGVLGRFLGLWSISISSRWPYRHTRRISPLVAIPFKHQRWPKHPGTQTIEADQLSRKKICGKG